MGEAKRKAAEWTRLFSSDLPARLAISRPSSRPRSTRQYENGLAVDIARMCAAGKPALCFNLDCESELHTVPEVRAFLRTSDDPRTPPIAMGVCVSCAKLGDAALLDMARKTFGKFGLSGPPEQSARVEVKIPSYLFSAAGVEIAVCRSDNPEYPICDVAAVFARLIEDQKLPRFMVFRHGAGNCHSIVDQLYLDMKEIGWDDLLSFKRGFSGALKAEWDPNGLHSWIEANGWVIDAASGGIGKPVVITPVEEFYRYMQITDVRELTLEFEGQR